MILFYFVVYILLITLQPMNAEQICSPINGHETKCVPFESCRFVNDAITKYNKPPKLFEFVRTIICGYEGEDSLICCSDHVEAEYILGITTTPIITTTLSTSKINIESRFTAINSELPVIPNCGFHPKGDRIYGGTETAIDEFPWMALLGYKKEPSSPIEFECGGSLINNRYVITAAHCLERYNNPVIVVRLGEYDKNQETDCDRSGTCIKNEHIDVGVEKYISHPKYYRADYSNRHDIGLIRLSEFVNFSFYISPICIKSSELNVNVGKELFVSGWGETETLKSSNIKLKVSVPLFDKSKCFDIITSNTSLKLIDSQICAGGKGGKDSCQGDSGGPLMLFDDDSNAWYLYGVVSTGSGCGEPGIPALYTSVFAFYDWIISTLKP